MTGRTTAELLLGNEAIARGILEAGAEIVSAYPGTPSTEILESVQRQRDAAGLDVRAEWAVNEKVAFDVALGAAMCGKRAATAMKQVGLNVAGDSLLSAAYTGVEGGFVVVVADDPGPHSSQTEQDTRLFALFAKVPVLDPATPREAREMAREAFELSERFGLPVLLRPTTRVCHARQPMEPGIFTTAPRPARFRKDPARWAATPRHRFALHGKLNEKLEGIREAFERSPFNRSGEGVWPFGVIASGHAWAMVADIVAEEGLDLPVLKIGTPYPLPHRLVEEFLARCGHALVLEEPDAAIELQIRDRSRVQGRLTGHVPGAGELTPGAVARLIGVESPEPRPVPGPPPNLCLGCGHRAAFLAIKQALPKAIYAGDIGCYTLGVNQGALDICLDMGASITLAEGLYHAHRKDGSDRPIVAVIGDSTFFHAGLPGLLNCVAQDARIVVVVLDNATVAMTGHQPTPAERGADIERAARGLGVRFVETIDPYEVDGMVALLHRAHAFTRSPDGGPALVIARRPCALLIPPEKRTPVEVLPELCNACDRCLRIVHCPALVKVGEEGKVDVDRTLCVECGVCVYACPQAAIVAHTAEVEP